MNKLLTAASALLVGISLAHAATLTWDSNGAAAPNPQDGAGAWDLASANWYNGSSNVAWTGGNDAVSGCGGTAGTVSLGSGIVVQCVTFASVSNGNYTLSQNSLTLTGTPTVTVNVDATVNSALAGSPAWTKAGSGTLTLGSSNTFSGALTVSAGTLWAKHTNALGGAASILTVADGASLVLDAASGTFDKPLNLSGSGTASNGVLATTAASGALIVGNSSPSNRVTLAADSVVAVNGTSLQVNRIITGSGKLIKRGSGTLLLAATNDYTGETLIEEGKIQLSNNAGLGSTAVGTVVSSGATLDLRQYQIGEEAVTIQGSGVGSTGAIVSTYFYTTAGSLKYLSLAGDATAGGTYDWSVGSSGSQLNLNGYTLTKIGSMTLTLSGTTVANGSILVNAGTLALATPATIGGSGTITVNAGATLYTTAGLGTITKPTSLNGGTVEGANGWVGRVLVNAATGNTFHASGSGGLGVYDGLGGTGNVSKTGSYSLYIQGDSSEFSGKLTVTAGAVCFNSAAAGSAAATWEITGGSLLLNAGSMNVQLGALTGTGGSLYNYAGGNGTFTIGGNGASTTYAGTITNGSGSLGITKVGSGTLTLTKTNTYSGATTVSGGALLVNGAHPSSAVTVQSGGTLGGTGSVNAVTVQQGGALAPGSGGIGTLSATTVTLESGGIVDWQYGATASDLIAVSGTLTLPSNAVIVVSAGGLEMPDEVPVFSYNTLAGATNLEGWTVNGADSYGLRIDSANKKVVLRFLAEGPVYEVK